MSPSSPTTGCWAAQSCAGLLPEAIISMKLKIQQPRCSEDDILADYSLSSHSYILSVSSFPMFPEAYSPMASHSIVYYSLFLLEVTAVTPRYAWSVSDRSWQQYSAVGINIGIKKAIGGPHYVHLVNVSSHPHIDLPNNRLLTRLTVSEVASLGVRLKSDFAPQVFIQSSGDGYLGCYHLRVLSMVP